jgi:Putative peptidoglycan binding domain/Phage tail lysozyme
MKIIDIIKESTNSDKVIILGDSIALGLKDKVPGATVNAKIGRPSNIILSQAITDKSIKNADLAIISVGSNDIVKGQGNVRNLKSNVAEIRKTLNAEHYIWILPFDKVAATAITAELESYPSDKLISLSKVTHAANDGVHPESYSDVATKVISLGTVLLGAMPETDSVEDSQVIKSPGRNRKDPNIGKIQKLLLALGYSVGPSGVDNQRGPYTTDAIKQYQQDNNLKITGIPDDDTVAAMNAEIDKDADIADKVRAQTAPTQSFKRAKSPASKNIVSQSDISAELDKIAPGIDNIHKAGILANIQGESGFNSSILGDGGTSGGLFQHHGSRFKAMTSAVPDWKTNWQGQIQYALSEPEAKGYLTTKFKNPQEASTWWVNNFEKTKNPASDIPKRNDFASNIHSSLG